MKKKCYKCGRVKPIEEFYHDKNSKDGYTFMCKACHQAQNRKYSRFRQNHPKIAWAESTIGRHRERGIIVKLTGRQLATLVKSATHCYLCGCKLNWLRKSKVVPNSPTMDRIDNEKFIDKSNIAILCHRCNGTKRDRTLNEFLGYCELIINRYRRGKIKRR